MEQLIVVRQQIIGFYKKFEVAVNYILKFFVGLFIFSRVNSLGMYREEFEVLFGSGAAFSYLALLSLLFTISPPSIALFLVAVAVAIQLSVVLEVAFFVFLLLILLIVFYARLAPRHSMLILAMVFGFHFNMPYAVVLFAGLYFGVASIIPVILGTAVWYFLPFFTNLTQEFAQIAAAAPVVDYQYHAEYYDVSTTFMEILFELPATFLDVFSRIFTQLTTDFNWIVISFVFAMILLAANLISRIAIDYSKDIAIGVGAVVGMVCMIMVVMAVEVDMTIGGIFISSIFSALFVWIASFFEGVRDYQRVERVQFDDEDNYYFVRIVPKVSAEKTIVSPKAAKTPKAQISAKQAARPVGRMPVKTSVAAKPPAKPPAKPSEYDYRSKLINSDILNDEDK